ncbi:MAG TPA: hypothetical protein DCZ91_14150 [Lachnospiraceae bacterium]|nr:hypothetical protein [Lachnospiraceae bacterium]
MSMPVLLYYRSSVAPTAQDVEDAVMRLEGYADKGDASLQAYLQKVDQIYDGNKEYQNQLVNLYLSVCKNAAGQEVTQMPALQSCCSCGTWQVYSDDTEAALVCLMGRSCLILYYDPAEQDFCGFRMEFHF